MDKEEAVVHNPGVFAGISSLFKSLFGLAVSRVELAALELADIRNHIIELVAIFAVAALAVWFAIAFIWEKATGRRAAVAPPSETPDGEAAPLSFGAHVPFGPMLAIAGALYFLFFRHAALHWLADVSVLF